MYQNKCYYSVVCLSFQLNYIFSLLCWSITFISDLGYRDSCKQIHWTLVMVFSSIDKYTITKIIFTNLILLFKFTFFIFSKRVCNDTNKQQRIQYLLNLMVLTLICWPPIVVCANIILQCMEIGINFFFRWFSFVIRLI